MEVSQEARALRAWYLPDAEEAEDMVDAEGVEVAGLTLERWRHQRKSPSSCIRSQLYVGKPQFCPSAAKSSGGAPADCSVWKRCGAIQTSTLWGATPMGRSPLRKTPRSSA